MCTLWWRFPLLRITVTTTGFDTFLCLVTTDHLSTNGLSSLGSGVDGYFGRKPLLYFGTGHHFQMEILRLQLVCF